MTLIELPVRELKAALPGLRQIIPRKVTLPILNTVRIERQLSGRLTLQATDLDSTATYHTQTEPGQSPVILQVPANELTDVLKRAAKDDSIQLANDGDTLRLRHRVAGHWLERPVTHLPAEEWPALTRLDHDPIALPETLPATLKTAFEFMAGDHKANLHGGWLDVSDPQGHYVMASNGHALFTANSFTFGLKESLLVPYHAFLAWEGFQTDGAWTLRIRAKRGEKPAMLQLGSDHWTYVRTLAEVAQPHWRQAIPAHSLTQVRFSEEGALALLELLRHLPQNEVHQCRCDLLFSAEHSTVTGRDREHVQTAELTGLTVSGRGQAVGLNRKYVIQALKLGLRELELTDDRTPVRFHGGGRQLVIAPLRPENERTPHAEVNAPPQTPTETANTPPAENPPTETNTPEPQPMNAEKPTAPATPATETKTALQLAIEKIEALKESLRGMLTDLNDALKVLQVAQREKRASEKEVEEVRAALDAVKKLRL